MEVIVDELQKNGVNVDVTLLNIHVNRILCVYKTMYDEATSRLKTVDQLIDVFHENCFNTPARVMAYLTLIRCMNQFIITMEVIQDELQKNNVRIDIETLTEHIEYILNNYKDAYTHALDRLTREELLLDVFHEMDVNSLGRAMSYLTLVYRMSHKIKEDTVRQAVRLVAPLIRNTGRVEGSFIRELCAWGRSLTFRFMGLNLWDLL